MNPQPLLLRIALALVLAAPLSFAQADNGRATDDAFAALLSMPGAEPEIGSWNTPVPKDFRGKTEPELIRWLEQKQKQGADFNAYRHSGTLLHHAIRARLGDTAIWLLQHGADPRLQVKYLQQDALMLASATLPAVAEILAQAPYSMSRPTDMKNAKKAKKARSQPFVLDEVRDLTSVVTARQLIFNIHKQRYMEAGYPIYAQRLAEVKLVRARIPSATFAAALDDDDTLTHWTGWLSTLAPPDFADFLLEIEPALLQARMPATLQGMIQHTRVNYTGEQRLGKNPVDPKNWQFLFERVPGPLNSDRLPPLLQHIETEFWPLLFKRGYRIRDPGDDLEKWLTLTSPEQLRQLWPLVYARAPALKKEGIALILRSHAPGGVGDCRYTWPSIDASKVEKIEFLVSQGVHRPGLELDPQCSRTTAPELIHKLVALQVVKPFIASAGSRFAIVRTACKFTFNDAWYQALHRNPAVDPADFPVSLGWVQAIPLPDRAGCALLVAGDQSLHSYHGGFQDGFTGPSVDPVPSCPDPTARAAVWRLDPEGNIEKLPADDAAAHIIGTVRYTGNGRRYWLAYGSSSRCDKPYAVLLDWKVVDGKPALLALHRAHPAWQALVREADPARLEEHAVFKTLVQPEPLKPEVRPDHRMGGALIEFINAHRAKERTAYLNAIRTLDKPALEAMEAQGIPPYWTDEALIAVSNSTLPMADKRRRMAWLFKNHEQLAAAGISSNVPASLVTWLPREDWWPLLKVFGASEGLTAARDKARELGKTQLACDMDRAMGLICGETLSAEKRAQ